ncbi:MAG TPA: hypothetical protein VE224_05250 [Pseudolabrys sp.]|jgi:hypothetical protein|nr:hypothetical protein [Pseudolabrys sp.]
MAADFEQTMQSALRANIARYRRILTTPLTEHERQFILRRLAEEQAALSKTGKTAPLADLARD